MQLVFNSPLIGDQFSPSFNLFRIVNEHVKNKPIKLQEPVQTLVKVIEKFENPNLVINSLPIRAPKFGQGYITNENGLFLTAVGFKDLGFLFITEEPVNPCIEYSGYRSQFVKRKNSLSFEQVDCPAEFFSCREWYFKALSNKDVAVIENEQTLNAWLAMDTKGESETLSESSTRTKRLVAELLEKQFRDHFQNTTSPVCVKNRFYNFTLDNEKKNFMLTSLFYWPLSDFDPIIAKCVMIDLDTKEFGYIGSLT